MSEQTSAEGNGADDLYGDGEIPEDADLNAPGAKNETTADEAVEDVGEALPGSGKLDNDGQLPEAGSALP
jgi:hypothetical protein